MICGNRIATQESRGVDDNIHTENADVMANGSGDIYLRYRQPGLTKSAGGQLMFKVDEEVNKTITDLHISYEEPYMSTMNTRQTTT